jgi:acyl-CoA thioesterase-1
MRNEGEFRRAQERRAPGLLRCAALAICTVFCVISGSLRAEAAAATRVAVILVLGDSFTGGLGVPREKAFPAQLEARLLGQGKAVRAVNKGISGDITAGGRARVDRALADEKPDLVILELGTNDAFRGIQPAFVRANLDAIITKIQASGAKLLLTGVRAPPNWGEEYRIAFDRIYPDLARIRCVPLYPFFLQGVALNRQLIQPDGLHPNERGVAALVDRIAPVVQHLIRDQPTGQIPVATATGIVSMDDQEYGDQTRNIGNLPVLSRSYIFGSSIPMPKTDHQGHIRVSDGTGPAASPSAVATPVSAPTDRPATEPVREFPP